MSQHKNATPKNVKYNTPEPTLIARCFCCCHGVGGEGMGWGLDRDICLHGTPWDSDI